MQKWTKNKLTEQTCYLRDKPCDSKRFKPLFDMPFDVKSGRGTEFGSIHQCEICGLKLVYPLPKAEDIPAHYDLPRYYTHGADHIPETEPTFIERAMMHLAWRTDRGSMFDPSTVLRGDASNWKVLDIGCGSGDLLSSFSDMGLETFGLEPDANARSEAEKRGHRVFSGTAELIPDELRGRKFEVVTITHVLEHCLSPIDALKNAREFLAEDGVLYCEVPNAGSLYFQTYSHISEMLDVPRHLFFFRKTDLEALTNDVGLEIIKWNFHGLTRHFSASWKAWENTIFDRIEKNGHKVSCGRRSVVGDLMLLASGAFQPKERRYDSIGFLARVSPRS